MLASRIHTYPCGLRPSGFFMFIGSDPTEHDWQVLQLRGELQVYSLAIHTGVKAGGIIEDGTGPFTFISSARF